MIRRFLANFFQGRNGFDQLAGAIWLVSIVFLLLSAFTKGLFSAVCNFVSLILIIWAFWRVCSKNIGKRSRENARFLEKTSGLRTKFRDFRTRFSMRKDYKFFTCPTCHTLLRVPRGKGKIQITCSKCGNRFPGKT